MSKDKTHNHPFFLVVFFFRLWKTLAFIKMLKVIKSFMESNTQSVSQLNHIKSVAYLKR